MVSAFWEILSRNKLKSLRQSFEVGQEAASNVRRALDIRPDVGLPPGTDKKPMKKRYLAPPSTPFRNADEPQKTWQWFDSLDQSIRSGVVRSHSVTHVDNNVVLTLVVERNTDGEV